MSFWSKNNLWFSWILNTSWQKIVSMHWKLSNKSTRLSPTFLQLDSGRLRVGLRGGVSSIGCCLLVLHGRFQNNLVLRMFEPLFIDCFYKINPLDCVWEHRRLRQLQSFSWTNLRVFLLPKCKKIKRDTVVWGGVLRFSVSSLNWLRFSEVVDHKNSSKARSIS